MSSDAGLTQVSLHRCSVYGRACSDCCLARDPYCAWDGESCSAFTPSTKRSGLVRYCHLSLGPVVTCVQSLWCLLQEEQEAGRQTRRPAAAVQRLQRQRCAGFLVLQTRFVPRSGIICSPCLRAVEKRLRETMQFGVEGSSTFLECQPRSPQASVKWLFQGDGKRKLVGQLTFL